jgi:hypothetical protein
MRTTLLFLLTLIGTVACLDEGTPPPTEAVTAQRALEAPPSAAAVAEVCSSLMLRQRDCSALFLPALVAERVRRDMPAGTAQLDVELGREALLATALAEYAEDSREPAIMAVCDKIAASISSERATTLLASGGTCLAHTECEALVACAVPLNVMRWTD